MLEVETPFLRFPQAGLYAITADAHDSPGRLLQAVGAALRGGVKAVQYRPKSTRERLTEARLLLAQCRAANVPFIINDDVELALAVGADGVHLGRDDGALLEARTRLGDKAIIGASCYDSLERAEAALREGADYVAFGRFFPSKTKPNAPCAHPRTLVEAKRRFAVPIVAIGGITPENAVSLRQAGADVLAVIEGVFGAPDPEQAARAFQTCFP